MADNEDAETSTTAPVITRSGYTIDLNNVSGKVKREMIQSGDLSIDKFTTPDNMPGKKLAVLREQAREQMKVFIEELEPVENLYKVGDVVEYKGVSSEVVEVSETGIRIKRENGEISKWIPFSHKKLKFQKENEEE